MKRLIVGISGASGAIYGVRLLQILRDVDSVETHLVMSGRPGKRWRWDPFSLREVQALADVTHDARGIAASISRALTTAGMVILPVRLNCRGLSTVILTDCLPADVILKSGDLWGGSIVRRLPLHIGHLRLILGR